MKKSTNNLFEALANYDYEAMINLYASNGIDGLESVSNLTSVHYAMPGMPFSISSEEKFDESFHLGRPCPIDQSISIYKYNGKDRNNINNNKHSSSSFPTDNNPITNTTNNTTSSSSGSSVSNNLSSTINKLYRIVEETTIPSAECEKESAVQVKEEEEDPDVEMQRMEQQQQQQRPRSSLFAPRQQKEGDEEQEQEHHRNLVSTSTSKETRLGPNSANVMPYLPHLGMNMTSLSSSSSLPSRSSSSPPHLAPATEIASVKCSLSINFRNFRRHKNFHKMLPFESKRYNRANEPLSSSQIQMGGQNANILQDEIEEHLYERAKILSNSRPESSFTVHRRREYKCMNMTTHTIKEQEANGDRKMPSSSHCDTLKDRKCSSSSSTGSNRDTLIHNEINGANMNDSDDDNTNNNNDNPTTLFFDGAVANGTPVASSQTRGIGGGSGTIQHLACAIDSPFGLALVVALGADVSSRHTAFRRLVIHEAACCDSPNCLRLLLEMGRMVSNDMNMEVDEYGSPSSVSGLASNKNNDDGGCMGSMGISIMGGGDCCLQSQQHHDERYAICDHHDLNYPVKRQKSSNCLLDLASKSGDSKGMRSSKKIPFTALLQVALDLVGQMKAGIMDELDAARHLLSKATLSESNKNYISLICKVDQHHAKKTMKQTYPHFISYARVRDHSAVAINNADGHGNTALHWASFKNAASCVSLLFKYGANPNAVAESTGWTPLHDAAYSDSAESISILVEAGADVNSRAHSGATPLCFAAQEDSPNAARLLLYAGADPSIRCCESGVSNNINDDSDNSQQFLLQQSRFSGYTPLHYCAHYNSHRAAVVLLEFNTKMRKNLSESLLDIPDLNNKLPIHIVAERGSSDVMRELLHSGVRVDSTGSEPNADNARQDESQDAMSINSVEEEMETLDAAILSSPNATDSTVITPTSSPVLQSLIPSEPIRSSKPWNCLSQTAIDECKMLLQQAELSWAPNRHYIFSPNDRVSIEELVKVGVRLNHIPQEIWRFVLSFCGRGWFDRDLPSSSSAICE